MEITRRKNKVREIVKNLFIIRTIFLKGAAWHLFSFIQNMLLYTHKIKEEKCQIVFYKNF